MIGSDHVRWLGMSAGVFRIQFRSRGSWWTSTVAIPRQCERIVVLWEVKWYNLIFNTILLPHASISRYTTALHIRICTAQYWVEECHLAHWPCGNEFTCGAHINLLGVIYLGLASITFTESMSNSYRSRHNALGLLSYDRIIENIRLESLVLSLVFWLS